MKYLGSRRFALGSLVLLVLTALPQLLRAAEAMRAQPRPHGVRVAVPLERLKVDDGDTMEITWKPGDVESLRILGIDAPETYHPDHGIPFDQPFGREATAFARGVFAMADTVELVRASTLDPYGRTLGYLFVNGRNFSVLLLNAHLAAETVSHYGDNGLPEPAAACVAAAAKAGPVPFEPPYLFRRRMSEYGKARAR